MQIRLMEKRQRNKGQLGKARHFLQCVILEQRAAMEELRASNRELERLLEDLLGSRQDLRSVAPDEPETAGQPLRPDLRDFNVTQLHREAEEVLAEAAIAIRDSTRLRSRSHKIRLALRKSPPPKDGASPQSLSKRERQVLTLIVDGKSSKEIAAELGISFKTAVTHRASIMSKLDVHEIASVVREAIRRGLV
ncbi:MAG TPA: LuxR C-terminal-related transcriptional regulator [Burkholderiales bacterium]|nr:LuxR C-terminal-related transcriptional regulator [Burkholderiales bacterium]